METGADLRTPETRDLRWRDESVQPQSTPTICPLEQRKERITVCESPKEVGQRAAEKLVELLKSLAETHGKVLLVLACAPSQHETWDALLPLLKNKQDLLEKLTFINMDEYVGINSQHPESFNGNLQRRFFDELGSRVSSERVHLMCGNADVEAEVERISGVIREFKPENIVVMGGFGTNGHLAFDDHPITGPSQDGEIPMVTVRKIAEVARQQQVTDGCFATLDDVPTHCITLTCDFFRRWARGGIVLAAKGSHKTDAADSLLQAPNPESPVTLLYQSLGDSNDIPATPWVFLDSKAGSRVKGQLFDLAQATF
jgi:glucosamine-6-phosphate deaminase